MSLASRPAPVRDRESVCVRERERECVFVKEREGERERESEREREREHLLGAGHGSEHERGAQPRVFEVWVGVRVYQHLPFHEGSYDLLTTHL